MQCAHRMDARLAASSSIAGLEVRVRCDIECAVMRSIFAEVEARVSEQIDNALSSQLEAEYWQHLEFELLQQTETDASPPFMTSRSTVSFALTHATMHAGC